MKIMFGPGMSPARGFLGRSLVRTADTLGFPMIYVAAVVPLAAAIIIIHLGARIADPQNVGSESVEEEPL